MHSQTLFEKGFFIRNNKEKVECEIKNEDWLDNPKKITYRLEGNEIVNEITVNEIESFEILNESKYIKSTVEISKNINDLYKLNNKRDYEFEKQTLFLKVLVEGDLSLYQYTNSNQTNFYIEKKGEGIVLLMYNEFLSSDGKIKQDRHYRQQLYNRMKDSEIEKTRFENLLYYKQDLTNLVKEYNELNEGGYREYTRQNRKGDAFHISIRPGISNTSLYIIDDAYSTSNDVDFGKQLTFRIGLEAEYTLPFRNNKWALLLEPAFQSYTNQKELNNQFYNNVNMNYKSIEIGMGVRHYAFINDNAKIYINGLIINDNDIKATLNYSERRKHEINSNYNLAFGFGYTFKNKISLEIRYYTNRDLLNDYLNFKTEYQNITFITGIKL